MCPDAGFRADQGDVDEGFRVKEGLKGLQDVRLMVVPPQRVVRLEGHLVRTLRGAGHLSSP